MSTVRGESHRASLTYRVGLGGITAGYAVTYGLSDGEVVTASSGQMIVGIPTEDYSEGESARVVTDGEVKAISAEALSYGDVVTPSADGRLIERSDPAEIGSGVVAEGAVGPNEWFILELRKELA